MDKELNRTVAKPDLPKKADTLLPHKPPMLLVEALVQRQGSRTVALATLPIAGLFVTVGSILPEYFIELIAQTAALGNCYDALMSKNASRDGMLVGIDTFSWSGQPRAGIPVYIETDIAFTFGSMKVVHGEVYAGAELLAAGDIKVWEDLGKESSNSSQVNKDFHQESGRLVPSTVEKRVGMDDDSLFAALLECCLERRFERKEELQLEGSAKFRFPVSCPGFEGHFPGKPILPAIVQLAAVRFLTEHFLGQCVVPVVHQKIKFKGVIRPGDHVTANIVLKNDGVKWGGTFSLKRPEGEAVAGGIVNFAF